MPDPTDRFLAQTEDTIQAWHGITAPNAVARQLAAELVSTIRSFEAQRHRLRFEDEPSGFETALHDMAEPDAEQGA